MANTILEDLYRHNRWANAHIVRLCDGLTDDQLDQPRELGFGTLRNTVFLIFWLPKTFGLIAGPASHQNHFPSMLRGFPSARLENG